LTLLIALVGMPGSGKSTAGRHLAKRLGWRFVDADAQIETRIGGTIRSYFEREGEVAFRDVESAVIADLSTLDRTVIATGGGAVVRSENRAALRAGCQVIYLRTSPEELFRRLRNDQQRPMLQVADPQARLRQLHAERDPLYRETAHFTIETGRPTVQALIGMILSQLELAGIVDSHSAAKAAGATPKDT
jgi:shikimate kinase